jgi:hypothetical protein
MKKSIMPILGLYALSMMEHATAHQEFMEDINRPITRKKVNLNREVKKVIPNGCKEYVFNESFGILKVIAMNEKSAFKKYNKWCYENES